jgi:alanyl-tRNA synthetase
METERLFDQDSFQKEFTAQVLACEKGEEGYQVVLDRTAFFPEGGGQTADTGLLLPEGIQLLPVLPEQEEKEPDGVVHVFDVQEENGVIYHKTDVPVEPGTRVTGKLHWEERFLKMQHHS